MATPFEDPVGRLDWPSRNHLARVEKRACSPGIKRRPQAGIILLMPPVVIDIRSAEDSRDVVHRAVQALAEGKLVALPTETVYGLAASALDEAAIKRLLETKK